MTTAAVPPAAITTSHTAERRAAARTIGVKPSLMVM